MLIFKEKKVYIFLSIILTFVVRYWYWLYSNFTIEDAYIIGRIVRNLLNYGVYSYNPPERVSSATSPIFVLITTLISSFGFNPIESAKIIGIISSVLLAVLIYNLLTYFFNGNYYKSFLGMVFYIFLPPVINYSVNGMETSFYTLFIGLTIYQIIHKRYFSSVLYATLSFLIRPDGIIILCLIGIVVLREQGFSWKNLFISFSPVLLIFIFYGIHWLYFGTLFPQSLLAKSIGYEINITKNVLKYLNRMFLSQPLGLPVYLFAIFGSLLMLKHGWKRPLVILLGWYFAYHLFFMLRAPLFDWYLHPPLFVLTILGGYGLLDISEELLKSFLNKQTIIIIQSLGTFILTILLIFSLKIYSNQKLMVQTYETNVREKAGEWLSQNTKKTDLVFTESLGYIGYYCENRFVDWPGLVSPSVTQLLNQNENKTSQIQEYKLIIETFYPDYLVLRNSEWEALKDNISYLPCAQFSYGKLGPGYIVAGLHCP